MYIQTHTHTYIYMQIGH